ncbi:erythromycin esterase [Sphaerisporangium melleum]|uniref:Erythromycin esterase n=1 Tax=Sphaerisporangium melleum TaxID=321316 RepID=A0A917QXY7_9ACTN|nr:erythromycin esterase family protein [Sphaerisporangium melleum]GGK75411.1 erythromycin esterase [Sphaerisporangium melleum]GII72629.1 erythromycin esterase [Sphaerisporangium melleum]
MADGGLADWIRAHGHPVAALDLRAPLDDLAPLSEIVGSARVVALGESSHHVREFHQVRHRMLRFLVERCGFTIFAMEAPFAEGTVLDGWLRGGPGAVEDVVRDAVALGLGDVPELHEVLRWLRAYNGRPGGVPVRYAGADLPGSLGSPLPAIEAVTAYVETYAPDVLPKLAQARELAGRLHDPEPMKVLFGYPSVDQAERDALTTVLAELVARTQRTARWQRACGRTAEYAMAAHRLRGAWLVDQLHRSMVDEGIEVASTFRDVYMAESVLHLLERDPGARIVLTAHNWHLRKAPVPSGSGELFPAGYHLAAELGADYRAIAVTSRGGRTAIVSGDLSGSGGLPFRETALPPLEDAAIESAFPGSASSASWTIADLRAATAVSDAGRYTRMRMADYFCDQPAFDCFDAVVCVAETNGTEHTRPA